ncbi:MAG TPA: TIGR01212 family radical SAM protein [Bacteroidales bacterium]|nr:TIGR01212 family radical SAM protein [Bacteroidales bacterium]HPT21020.1 TIGR01212 family radical SAM protein [Bacteroidales bacterium]
MSTGNIEKRVYPWGDGRRFNAYSGYFRNIYGGRVQKVSIDAGFTCPNRDGSKGSGGCTYCNNDAFNPSYCIATKPVSQQIREGVEFHKWRYRRSVSYLAYFQAYSNTYAPLERLKQLYEEALNYPGVIGIVIGTRPDCIDDEKIAYLKELSEKWYVMVEYGIESCYNATLKRINRGHSFEDAVRAIEKTASLGINTGAHIIFGLPGESRESMLNEAEIISELPLTTIKFHQLQIFKGTTMEKEFVDSPEDFELFTLEEYLDFFVSFLERLNPSFVVERFTGEAPPRFQAGKGWGKVRTDQIVTCVEKLLDERDTWQGRLYKGKGCT